MQNDYSKKSIEELNFIARDAHEAAQAMRGVDAAAECKYLDQVNDACTELHKRNKADKRRAELRAAMFADFETLAGLSA